MSEWIKAGNLEQVKEGQLFGFTHGDKKILLANLKGKIHATDLICTHANADLSTGFLSEDGVRCPLHLSVFNLENGEPQNLPAENPLKVYNVKIDNNEIYVEV
ncbi:non-heme iron oxygenase ferredoxin subunit [Marine Group I thaumarchaeote]|uniref:Non-heme iron oxygenase ferredoxin subunit n=1 Tax=Marine Group I thaumarchaeote TaxID=2511932 RepID=A0A7K4P3E8_9ARCH|nr:MAG: non-heme iron oxygenase ferredoxin subunit [Nitrosopumilus sp. YT1]NMI81679.1 non-heme iron oxygenase ferredoxin subunit [Candidatus Nitrosopumilus sp. MTA1]NWJ19615.1 non-heme iron oxygenase ferredoxin subunit [Marine Group I thaumarchaeote]NWJ28010.1 non-heme iron oxygenase ferredoxin subunit [Marine Group I thaumarchaeote]NWJ56816.1 non-heme iron oxygenase ferredoxin subunit [Marine Group I thaumarchaeote]